MYSNVIFQKKKDEHLYTAFQLSYSSEREAFLQYILPVLKEEYGLGESFEQKTESLSDDRKEIMRGLMERYNTPNPAVNPLKCGRTQLKPTRSKIGEVIAKDYLHKELDVSFAGRISLEEDDADLPKRGVDNFGFIFKEVDGEFELQKVVICEVKASESKKNPPEVVYETRDSLYKSLLELSKGSDRLMKALVKSFDRFDVNKFAAFIAELAVDIEKNDALQDTKKKMMIVPFLLRTATTYSDDDFGVFYTDPSEFSGATINYYIMVVDVALSDFADDLYSSVRGES